MNVLSLFDGMSCGRIALERSRIKVDNYFASEIKPHAIKCSKANYQDIIHVGDVRKLEKEQFPKIDLLIGGSPCQDFSVANRARRGLNGEKSSLFYEFLRLKDELNPKYFLLENVKMDEINRDKLSDLLGVKPICINSIDFSFQLRERWYWTNLLVEPWGNKTVDFQSVKDTDIEYCRKFKLNKTPSRIKMWEGKCPNVTSRKYINCLTTKQDRWANSGLVEFEDFCRYLTTRELELAQTVPEGYTNSVSWRQAEDLLGDGWTVDVVAHIFKGIK